MSEPIESVETTIQLLQAKIRDLERQVTDQKKAVNSLCGLIGKPPMYGVEGTGVNGIDIFPDEFYGKNMIAAVRVVLDRRSAAGHGAASLEELFDALLSGGYQFETRNQDNCLRHVYNTLSKNAAVLHKLPDGRYGLAQWYAQTRTQKDAPPRPSETTPGETSGAALPNGEAADQDELPSVPPTPPAPSTPPAPAQPLAPGTQQPPHLTSLPAQTRKRKSGDSSGV